MQFLSSRSRCRSLNSSTHCVRFGYHPGPCEVGKAALSGAQPPELFRQAFEQVGEAAVAGEACEVDPATGKRGC